MENTANGLDTATDSAIAQVKKLLARDQREGNGLRVGVSDGSLLRLFVQAGFRQPDQA